MISVVYCTREHKPEHSEHIRKTVGLKDVEIIEVINHGESLTKVYNRYLDLVKYDIIVFCHDDIIFNTDDWGKKVIKHFKNNPKYGVLGKAGTTYMPTNATWWSNGMTEAVGRVYHQQGDKKWLSKYSEHSGNDIIETIIVDGLFIAVNKNNILERFDESVEGFHFYEIDFCFMNHLKGVKVGVILDVSITHLSVGVPNQQWENNRRQFINKFTDNLPAIIDYKYPKVKTVKSKEPLVSIVMPIYNYGDRLNQTLSSVFKQDYTNYEIIIVNDGSTDEFVKLKLSQLNNHERIRVINKPNGGPSSARNLGIAEAKGNYILPLDADDMILDGYIKGCVSLIMNGNNISPVYCDTIHVGEINGTEKRPEWSAERLIEGPFIVNCSMFTKQAFKVAGGYDESLIGWEDYDLWLRMMKSGYIGKRIAKPLFVYFHHEKDNTVSTKANQNTQALYYDIMSKNFEIRDGKIVL